MLLKTTSTMLPIYGFRNLFLALYKWPKEEEHTSIMTRQKLREENNFSSKQNIFSVENFASRTKSPKYDEIKSSFCK